MKRMQYVAEVVVDALREKIATNGGYNCGMSRQEVRDAARMRIGDTGLIIYRKWVVEITYNFIIYLQVSFSMGDRGAGGAVLETANQTA